MSSCRAGAVWASWPASVAARFGTFGVVVTATVADLRVLFFFFQAEDGIRDLIVTGVQTCALPICVGAAGLAAVVVDDPDDGHMPTAGDPQHQGIDHAGDGPDQPPGARPEAEGVPGRSEERRVGKEGRSRWSPYH